MNKKYIQKLWQHKYLFILLLLFISLYNPNFFLFLHDKINVAKNIYFIVDVSKSMDVEDMQGESRLNVVKNSIIDTITSNIYNNYALSVFAGNYFNVVPLTNDIETFINILSHIDTNFVSKQSTNFYAVMKNILQIKDGAVIIFSDGEDQYKNYKELLKDIKIPIYTIGVGTKEGGPIPIGNTIIGEKVYKKDSTGKIIISKLNDVDLKFIADSTGGKYVQLNTKDTKDLSFLINDFKTQEQKKLIKENNITFIIFVLIAFCLILLFLYDEYFHINFIEKNIINRNTLNYLINNTHIFFIIIFLLILSSCNNIAYYYNKKGIDDYNNNDYTGSIISFQNAYKEKKDEIFKYNHAVSEYKKNNFKESIMMFNNIKFDDKEKEKDRLYNLGNSLYKFGLGQKDPIPFWIQSLNAYSGALAINKNDIDAYKNYMFVLNKIKQKEEEKNRDGKSKDNQSKSDKKDGDNSQDNNEGQPQQGINTGEFTLNESQKQQVQQYIQQMIERQYQNMKNFKWTDEQKMNKNPLDSIFDENLFNFPFSDDPFFNPNLNRADDEY